MIWKCVYDPEPPPNPPKTFTQDELNSIVAEEKRKFKDQQTKLLSEIDQLKGKTTLTEKEKAEFDKRIEAMRSELLTKEEMAAKERNKLSEKFEEERKALTAERDNWREKYSSSTVHRALTDAAVTHKAVSPSQIVALLRENTFLDEDLNVKVKVPSIDKDKKPIVLELAPTDAVKFLTEIDEHKNLFRGDGTGGIGRSSSPSSGKMTMADAAKDPETWRKHRKEFGL